MRQSGFLKRALSLSAVAVLAAFSLPTQTLASPGPPPIPETPEPTYEAVLAIGLIGMGALAMRRKRPGSKDDRQ